MCVNGEEIIEALYIKWVISLIIKNNSLMSFETKTLYVCIITLD